MPEANSTLVLPWFVAHRRFPAGLNFARNRSSVISPTVCSRFVRTTPLVKTVLTL